VHVNISVLPTRRWAVSSFIDSHAYAQEVVIESYDLCGELVLTSLNILW
jgi:hypothetical protein